MTLGQSPPPLCLCGHPFHTGTCGSGAAAPSAARPYPELTLYCPCPNGELDGDR